MVKAFKNNSGVNIRGKVINYDQLDTIIVKYGFDKILLTKDIIPEYQSFKEIYNWLKRSDWTLEKSDGDLELYSNSKFFKNRIVGSDKVSKIDNAEYRIMLTASSSANIILDEPYNQGWILILNKSTICSNDGYFTYSLCQIKNIITRYRRVFSEESLPSKHYLANNYANGWIIDPEYVKKNLDKSQYKLNSDGSIDLSLTLYFKPQSYFYLGLFISGATLLSCVGYLVYEWRRRKKVPNDLSVTSSV